MRTWPVGESQGTVRGGEDTDRGRGKNREKVQEMTCTYVYIHTYIRRTIIRTMIVARDSLTNGVRRYPVNAGL